MQGDSLKNCTLVFIVDSRKSYDLFCSWSWETIENIHCVSVIEIWFMYDFFFFLPNYFLGVFFLTTNRSFELCTLTCVFLKTYWCINIESTVCKLFENKVKARKISAGEKHFPSTFFFALFVATFEFYMFIAHHQLILTFQYRIR